MVKLVNMLSRLNPAKVLVVGDMLLDTYTMGKVQRISPEAPVLIVNVQEEESRPGGAGNVILNLSSLGAQSLVIGRVGRDWGGEILKESLESEGVDARLLVVQEGYRTPVKNRVIAGNQQIVRIDNEQIVPLDKALEEFIIDQLPSILKEVKIIAISDYGKGFLTHSLLRAIISQANLEGIPIITDPKGHDFTKYRGTTIIKPNLGEAYAAAHLPLHAPLESVAAKVLQQTEAQWLMVTRSEAGISLFNAAGQREDFPVNAKEVKDVTGAGDTVLAMLTYALANQLNFGEAAQLCNVAAGIAIEHVGCVRVTLSALAHRLFEVNESHKIFDQDHLIVLREILRRKAFHLLIIPAMDHLTAPLYQAIRALSEQVEALVIYVDDPSASESFVHMLASWREVAFIILHLDHLKNLCETTSPQKTYLFDQVNQQLDAIEWDSYPLAYRLPFLPPSVVSLN